MAFDGPQTRRLYWGAWALLGLFMATQDLVQEVQPLTVKVVGLLLFLNLAQNFIWGLLSLITLRLIRRYPLHSHAPLRHWWMHLASGVAITVVGLVLISALAFTLFHPADPLLSAFRRFVGSYFSFEYLVCYWGVVGIHEGIQILKGARERDLQVSLLETKVAQAQLRTLQMQLNPNFLFNTLNSVSALMRTNPSTADRMLVKLSQLLRLSLEQSREEETSLSGELAFLESYLEVERMQFGGRLNVKFDVPEGLLDAQVPAFVLQPLLENAIHSGLRERGRSGTIHVRARQEDGMLTLEVLDDGQPEVPPEPPRHGESLPGIWETRSRLEQIYGANQGFDLQIREDGGTLARIRLPLSQITASPIFTGAALPA